MSLTDHEDKQDAPLWGARAIAQEIGRSERQTFYLLETRQLPARKVGASWVATRRRLREFLAGEP
jgi:hypothetical protein